MAFSKKSRPEHRNVPKEHFGAQQGGSEASPAHRRASEANLKVERFEEKAIAWPFRKKSRPEHRNVPKEHFGAQTEGERSEPGGRAFGAANKPTGTPARRKA